MADDKGNAATEAADLDIGTPAAPTVNWDDSNMRTTYANAVNAAATLEEVTLFFGTNQTWNLDDRRGEVHVLLSDRIVLNPYAAKRLSTVLSAVLAEYEKRFGSLDLGGRGSAARGRQGPKDS